MFKVQAKPCETCIYKKGSPMNSELPRLEDEVRDKFDDTMFEAHRVCHHSSDVCCRGFWNAHKDKFPAGQIAQRLDVVKFVDVDNFRQKQ